MSGEGLQGQLAAWWAGATDRLAGFAQSDINTEQFNLCYNAAIAHAGFVCPVTAAV